MTVCYLHFFDGIVANKKVRLCFLMDNVREKYEWFGWFGWFLCAKSRVILFITEAVLWCKNKLKLQILIYTFVYRKCSR